jgi:glycine/D-amino acid oxidase-like deaminating enzyme
MKRKRSNRDSASRAEPEVRIHLPPAESPRTIGSAGDFTGSMSGSKRSIGPESSRELSSAGATARAQGALRPVRSCVRTDGSDACGPRRACARRSQKRSLDQYGIDYAVLTGAQLRELEPHVSEKIVGAIHFRGSPTSSDPGMLTPGIWRHERSPPPGDAVSSTRRGVSCPLADRRSQTLR